MYIFCSDPKGSDPYNVLLTASAFGALDLFQLDHLGAKVSARPLVLPQIEGQSTFLVKLDRNRKSFAGFPESSLFFERNPLQNRWRACPRSHLWEFELAQCVHMFGLFRSSPLENSSPRCAKASECKTTFDPFSIMSCDLSTLALGRLFLLTLATETRTRRSCFISTKHKWRRAAFGPGAVSWCVFSFKEAAGEVSPQTIPKRGVPKLPSKLLWSFWTRVSQSLKGVPQF